MRKDYDPNVDYMKKMQEAVQVGDLEQAAIYEQKRNEKIKGEGLSQYAQTHSYEAYLPKTTAKQMEEIFEKIQKREPFSYDLQADKLYAQYREQYGKQGKLAMEDAVGQAAELTGGYGNSYGQTLGQQAYAQELDKLDQLAPKLYEQARQAYEAQGDALYDQLEHLARQYEAEQEQEQEDFRRALEKEQLEYERAQAKEQKEYDRAQAQQKTEAARQKEEQDRAYSLALKMLTAGLMPSQQVLQDSGLSGEDAQKLYAANQPKTQGSSGSGSSGGSGSSSSSGSGSGSGGSGSGGSGKDSGAGGKTLTSTLWEKLRDAYRKGEQKGDLSEFTQYRSTLAAQGYDVGAFDSWARENIGKDYTTGGPKTVDQQSILALGYGPISMERLAQLIAQGEVEQYTQGDRIYYRRIPQNLQNPRPPASPVLP